VLATAALLAVACAPQRTTFTSKSAASASAANRRQSGTKVVLPATLAVNGTEEKLTNVKTLVEMLDANTARLEQGMYRKINRKNPVTKRIEHRVQTIVSVSGSVAKYETRDADTNARTFAGEIPLDEPEPFEKGLRALAEGRNDDLFAAIAGFVTMNYELDDDFAAKARVDIELRIAEFDPDPSRFHVQMRVKITGMKRPSTLIVDARIVPALPRPFNVIYIAFGQRGVADQKYLEVVEANPPLPPLPATEGQPQR
jgi:hypothetical protein